MKLIKRKFAMKPCSLLTVALVSLGTVSAWAQTPMQGSGHSGMAHARSEAESPAHHTMDHGGMSMKGAAPAEVRDPHAYADGLTLESGPYALPGPRQLRLADEHLFGSLLFGRLERVYLDDGNMTAYEARASYGNTYDRLVLEAEGEVAEGRLEEAQTELLWGHAMATYWDTRLGVRQDSGTEPDRTWLAFGVQGLAPYWFEVDATAYVGRSGRTALSLSGEYELLLTQRLVLQPRVEVNLYGKRDEARGLGSGVSDALAGLRLRYEFSRQFAPYIGVEWAGKFGQTADMARDEGQRTRETGYVAGVRLWF
ncbi:copper resistance protein B [Hahella sp. SMD15-11]|uniref:Copper resistance protein B n=1 Tax=Thermohahella caldifontis TaxID=3142973 RepID=A0AB39USQ0_9GAMM